MFDQVVFAGGGNRYWWQAGFWEVVQPELALKPRVIAGISAGAATACMLYTRNSQWVMRYYEDVLCGNTKNAYWGNLLRRGASVFPHYRIYRQALLDIYGESIRPTGQRTRDPHRRLAHTALARRTRIGCSGSHRLQHRKTRAQDIASDARPHAWLPAGGASRTDTRALRSTALDDRQRIRIGDTRDVAIVERKDVLEGGTEVELVALALDIPDMRRADHVLHP